MTENNSLQQNLTAAEKEEIIRSLLHKEGCWVDWGKACQKLHDNGVSNQEIFEQTGLQNSHQNLVIVASKVFESLKQQEAEEDLLGYYRGPRSDVLYELRILNHQERLSAAKLVREKNLDVDGAKEIAKAMKEFSHLSQPPSGFTLNPGDAVAYQYWKNARQKKTLADKARLIAEGLKYAQSATARQQIESLLTDIAQTPQQNAPLLPMYRLESDEELPCILPVAGRFPLRVRDLDHVPILDAIEPFGVVNVKNSVSVVTIPSWQVILKAEKPAVIFCQGKDLPKETQNKSEELLIVVDLAVTEWNANHYFLTEEDDNLIFKWFNSSPQQRILGQLLVILRPKKILDEGNLTQPWQMDD
ncbi:RuBisCO accumulation factor 1 [Cyanobacterium aponinum AL20118]|uniref:RuBisCO accumulation factor 1 n=1 Tax=Cyanobacterium aponinum AL20115 TaxID=3090662 RepID=A0AAF0ZDF3_9CHRO|nr:RuBisCO accumulation factor 1 [Cyanobacterium aponinum]WPF88258.1 RuBisCO accumulation factor 1 [Cyanobacterium aponinum AL20115]